MPSLLTSRSSVNGGTSGRPFSRVNSFKREWDDEEPSRPSREFEVPPSPERMARRTNSKNPSPSPDTKETAADRRRKAILAAMSENMPPATSASTYSSITAYKPTYPTQLTSSTTHQMASSSEATPLRPQQVLPSLPVHTSASLESKKRLMPWEGDARPVKKVATSSRSGSSKSSKSDTGPPPTLNIKQKLVLSSEQQKVLQMVVAEGKNMFFTGSAGTGKSVLLREIIKNLRKKYATAADAVAVTASTGIAACNIGGVTLHSFGGVGLALESADVLVQKVRKNKKAAARWLRTRVLIVDEVSMVDGDLFDKFCKIGQILRKSPKPFGGIQIIVTGDFFQLPPVTKGNQTPKFCFEAATWEETIHMSVNLTKVFRQKDERFVDMLNEMRFGRLSESSRKSFRQLSRPIIYHDGIEATELFPRREDVERSNNMRLQALNTDGWSYVSTDGGAVTDPVQREKILSNFMAPQQIMLKEDAQVMLIKNVDETLVNGSMGKVIGFCHKQLYFTDPHGRWRRDGDLDDVVDEEDRTKRIKVREMLLGKLAQGVKPLPVVQFKVPGGGLRDMLVEPDQFKAELPNGEVQASRSQLPLILAWAMSIHKSQGQTLDRVKVDLGKVFEKGQAYVALSRATSLDGLQVLNFSADKVMAHRKVAHWSTKLRDLNV